MRLTIPHNLGKDEVRRRLQSRSHELASAIPGGMAQVESDWPNDDQMKLNVSAMGQVVKAAITLEESQLLLEVDLPPALSFFEPIIAGAVRDQTQKLLAPPN